MTRLAFILRNMLAVGLILAAIALTLLPLITRPMPIAIEDTATETTVLWQGVL